MNLLLSNKKSYCAGCITSNLYNPLFPIQYKNREYLMCEECIDLCQSNAYNICNDCGSLFTEYHDQDEFCEECFNDHYGECTYCSNIVDLDDCCNYDNGTLCEHCFENYYFRCYDCEDIRLNQYGNDVNGEIICDDCITNYSCCERCNSYHSSSDIMYCEHCENYLCEDCYTDHGCNNYVHDYCHKPNPIFRHYDIKTKSIVTGNYNPKVLYMGFELEVCFDSSSKMNSASESIFELSNSESLFYLKDDSSLSPYGFEIVSHPMDLKCLITGFPWRNIISILRRNGGTSYDSKLCGFHIHTSNKYFGKTDYDINNMKIKIVNFVEKNWTEMAKIAKRCKLLECIENGQAKTADGYCHFQTNTRCGFRYCQAKNINISKVIKNLNYNKVLSYYPRVTDLKNTHRNVSYEYGRIRNAAINLQPHDTTEFRLYRGTLKLQSIVKYLTLTNAIIDYVKQYDSIVKTSTFEEFIQKSSYTKNFKKYLKLLQIGEGE